jgi:membrane-associated phospholipid phosphatase
MATAKLNLLWWKELSLFQKIFPAAFVLVYWTALNLLHGFRSDHLKMGIVILVLAYGGRLARRILAFVLPFLLTGIIYDSMRFYADYLRGPIHVTQPYLFDKFFFGINTAQGRLTPNEWCQLHTLPVLDFVTGLFYLIFIVLFALISAYFTLWVARRGTKKLSGEKIRRLAPGMNWGFLWLNLLGYSTYYWYAAAPPWYVAKYGLGPAQMDVAASQAGCVRFDQLLGTHFFSEMYGRAADVFGAIPSLHVSYPFLAALFAFKFGSARIFCVGFYLIMCFSAVYLNHHYILDILWGSSYALLIFFVMNFYYERKSPKT